MKLRAPLLRSTRKAVTLSATVAVPYTPRGSGRFRVHRPKLLQWHNCDDYDIEDVFEAFFRGVTAHEQGARVWAGALDESQ